MRKHFINITDVTFPSSKYQFFRILIKSDEKPNLKDVKAKLKQSYSGV